MKIYASRGMTPKYKVTISLDLPEEEYEYALATIYTMLQPYSRELNSFCKEIKFSKGNGEYFLYFSLKYKMDELVETTRRSDWRVALKVLLAKAIAEIPEYAEEFKDLIRKYSLNSTKYSAYKLTVKLVQDKFGIKLKTIDDDPASYWIDELPCSLNEYKSFLNDIYTKYKFEDIEGRIYVLEPCDMYDIGTDKNGRKYITIGTYLMLHPPVRLDFVYDPEIQDYARLR